MANWLGFCLVCLHAAIWCGGGSFVSDLSFGQGADFADFMEVALFLIYLLDKEQILQISLEVALYPIYLLDK